MAHFSDEAWADFARGIDHSETGGTMRKHLIEKCAECTLRHRSWTTIHSLGTTENAYAVPEDTLRMVKLQFEVMHRQQAQDYAHGHLVFDSFTQPALAGIRAGGISARQVVYEAEGLTIDLRFERQPRSSSVSVIGQVLAKGPSQSCWQDATVILWSEKGEPILAVKATTFGEFQLDFEPQNHLRLSIEAGGQRPVRIPLANLKELDC
jgi:hypothetical protein